MIVKELEAQTFTDPLRRAGYEAERQLAHYLKRAFEDDPYALVFNNLRIGWRDEVAQLDHLIVHRCGLLVIESKSVAGQVEVNEHGEWTRWWNRQGRGMPSPVLQGQRQLSLLFALLQEHQKELMEKGFLGLRQRTLREMRRDVLVAISDGGRITRKTEISEVVKADQVPDRVRSVAEQARRQGPFSFTDTELQRVQDFLSDQHVPLVAAPRALSVTPLEAQASGEGAPKVTDPTPVPVVALAADQDTPPVCRHCQSHNVAIEFGRNYYIKCAQCAGNTSITVSCAECAQPARIRKKGPEFRVVCAAGHERLYHVNPS